MYGESAVVIVFFSLPQPVDLIEYFAVLNHYFKKKDLIQVSFGLLISPDLKVIRRRLKDRITQNFSEEHLLSLLSGDNFEAYYSAAEKLEQVLGVEIRFEEPIES
jgi:hypothetical protein